MQSSAFHQLHPKIQRWIWRTGWAELRDVQEKSIPAILARDRDVVITAATAGGKTEAAMLPVLSTLVDDSGGSVRALHVSPLRALINDQFQRLELLCEELEIPVFRWHGDVGAAQKQKLRANPAGVLLITPESLEAFFVLRGHDLSRIFRRLDYVVVDELHIFLGSERGAQLQSLLHRLELAIRRRVPRIGLSATLGDLALGCDFLRPGNGPQVRQIESAADGQELRIQVRGYLELAPPASPQATRAAKAGPEDGETGSIARHLFDHLRGDHNLIFANSRAGVEQLTDRLGQICETERVANPFWPHHGNLSKELREDAEAALKERSRPATAICTSTLELGIDIGNIKSVAQVGRPGSVASLRQRLGRSGRAGEPAILRIYIQEPAVQPQTPALDSLRLDLVQTIAVVDLLLAGWFEPSPSSALHLSTLVQQVLSMIAQHGAARADEIFRALCQAGPFHQVDEALFSRFLRSLGKSGLLRQDGSGELVLGEVGEKLVNHYAFFATFSTPEEYRVTAGGRQLGSAPFSDSLFPGRHLIFGGRRWIVVAVDDKAKVVDLKPAGGGKPPAFVPGGAFPVHDRVRQEMVRIYEEEAVPRYLDVKARELLAEGRGNYRRLELDRRQLLRDGKRLLFFPWQGDRTLDSLELWLSSSGLEVAKEGVALSIAGGTPEAVAAALRRLAVEEPPSAIDLARKVENKGREKFHPWLDDETLSADYAAGFLQLEQAAAVLRRWADRTEEPKSATGD